MKHKQTFSLQQLLVSEPRQEDQGANKVNLPSFKPFQLKCLKNEGNQPFNPIHQFIPGWNGNALSSKEAQKLNQSLNEIHFDVKKQLGNLLMLPQKIKSSIFAEFLSFANDNNIITDRIASTHDFFTHLFLEDSPYKDILAQFIEKYSFRVAAIYIYKIRFISVLAQRLDNNLNTHIAYSPNSFLQSIFKRSSQYEIKSTALEANLYSWYRPSDDIKTQIDQLLKLIPELSISDLVVNFAKAQEKINKSADYSHALSSQSFGLFLNSLLINFPLWLQTHQNKNFSPYRQESTGLEIISSKYVGDFLESISLSHWLAQENNRYLKWEQILCPDFVGVEYETGMFLKLCHELQFLTFLAQIASEQDQEPVKFISTTIQGHLYNKKSFGIKQSSFFSEDLEGACSTYDRLIINLFKYPTNNSYHHLINFIQNEQSHLKETGLLFILSPKKLFIESQKNKLEIFLKNFKLEAILNFEDIKGKGEVPTYLYILSRKNSLHKQNSKESFCHFRFSGELTTFNELDKITELLQNFYLGHLNELPPIYHQEIDQIRIEFFQDALMDGRLLHSTSKDLTKITHPVFFKKLLNSFVSLDTFFQFQKITEKTDETSLPYKFETNVTEYPLVFIIDYRESNKIKLELIPASSFEAKLYDYGETRCYFIAAKPKWPHFPLNTLREYLNSQLGQQVVNIVFSGEIKEHRHNLSKFLVPHYFNNTQNPPEHIVNSISSYADKLKTYEFGNEQYTTLSNEHFEFLNNLKNNYPLFVINRICDLKNEYVKIYRNLSSSGPNNLIFEIPSVSMALSHLPKTNLYPNNQDIFFDFSHTQENRNLSQAVMGIKLVARPELGENVSTLKIHLTNDSYLEMTSEKEMILFVQYLINNLQNYPFNKIMTGLKVPCLADLKTLFKNFDNQKHFAENEINRLTKLFNMIMSSTLFTNQSH